MHRLHEPGQGVGLDDSCEPVGRALDKRQWVQNGRQEVQGLQRNLHDVLDISVSRVNDRQHQPDSLAEHRGGDQDRNSQDPSDADVSLPQEHADQDNDLQGYLNELDNAGSQDRRPRREMHLAQQLAVGLQLGHREHQQAGEQIEGDHSGEQERGKAGALWIGA